MGIFEKICGIFGNKGKTFYRKVTDLGKVTAPITEPIVKQLLDSMHLPTTPQSAVEVLTATAGTNLSIPLEQAVALQKYINSHL